MLECVSASNHHMVPFQVAARDLLWGYTPEKPLKTIIAVGMNYDAKDGVESRDSFWLSNTFGALRRMGVALDKDFKIIPVNMVNGLDILDPSLGAKGDVLMSCFIINPRLTKHWGALEEPREAGFLVSPHHSKKAWADAAKRVGARVVVTFNQDCEIRSKDFLRGRVADILHGRDHYTKGLKEEIARFRKIDGESEARFYNMEVVVRSDLKKELDDHGIQGAPPRNVYRADPKTGILVRVS